MKKILLLFMLTVAVLLSSCSSDGYKSYIPGDSKVIGKVDLKAFLSQSGVDADKLLKDISDQLGKEDAEKIKETGIDFNEPVYIFATGEGMDISFGLVAKVGDSGKLEKTLKEAAGESFKPEKEGDFNVLTEKGGAIGYGDDALIALFKADESDKTVIKTAIRKVINKESKQSLADNKVMDQVESNGGFMSLIADMSIIPAEAVNLAKQQGAPTKSFEDLRTTTITLDANVKDGICDIVTNYKSSNNAVQTQYDDALKAFNKVESKALGQFSADDVVGLAMNLNGPKVSQLFNDYVKQSGEDLGEMQGLLEQVYGLFAKLNGNFLLRMQLPYIFTLTAEGQNPSDDIAGLMSNMMGAAPQKTANGYAFNGMAWFGYADNNFYVTNSQELTADPVQVAATPIAPELTKLMQDRRYTFFVNVDKLKGFAPAMDDSDAQKAVAAFGEVLNKVHFITLSMK